MDKNYIIMKAIDIGIGLGFMGLSAYVTTKLLDRLQEDRKEELETFAKALKETDANVNITIV